MVAHKPDSALNLYEAFGWVSGGSKERRFRECETYDGNWPHPTPKCRNIGVSVLDTRIRSGLDKLGDLLVGSVCQTVVEPV